MILINAPARNPTRVPKEDLSACFGSFLLNNSPKNAPANGPTIIPIGPRVKIPTVKPKKEPQMPYRLALYVFAPMIGAMKSKIIVKTVSAKKIMTAVKDMAVKSVRYA